MPQTQPVLQLWTSWEAADLLATSSVQGCEHIQRSAADERLKVSLAWAMCRHVARPGTRGAESISCWGRETPGMQALA